MKHVVYFLKFSDGSVYIGATSHPERRRRVHEDGARLYAGTVNFEFEIASEHANEDAMYQAEIDTVVAARQADIPLRNKSNGGKGGTLGTQREYPFEARCQISETKLAQRRRCLKILSEDQLLDLHVRHSKGARPASLALEVGISHCALTAAWKRRDLPIYHWPLTGKRLSAATRARMSASRMGHPVSDETRERIAASKRGKPRSAECRAKIRAILLAKKAAV